MAVLLIRRRRPIGEPADDAATIHGMRGAGRVVLALTELGVELDGVVQLVVDQDALATDLAGLDAGGQFATVVLGSHLVNRPEEPARAALLALARRHLKGSGRLLIEHHPIDWAVTAGEVPATPGGRLGMVEVRRDPPFVSAVSVYDFGGRVVRQPFRARVLSDAELTAACESAGLVALRRLAPTWIEAGVPRSGA